jgi:hypothetical protein
MKGRIIAISLSVIAVCAVYTLVHRHWVEKQAAIHRQYDACLDKAQAIQIQPARADAIAACVAAARKAGLQ